MKSSSQNYSKRGLIRELFAGKKWTLAKAFVFVTFKTLPIWTLPIVTARIIDLGGQESPDYRRLVIYLLIAIGLILQNFPVAIFYVNNLVHVTRGIGRDLRIMICNQLQALSLHYHNRSSIGALHSKAIRDVEILEQLPKLLIEQGYSLLFGLTISCAAIAIRKPEALIFFAVAVPVCSVISGMFGRRIRSSVNDYRKSMEGMSMYMNEMVTMMPVTRAHGLEQYQLREVETGIDGLFNKGVHVDKLTMVFAASSWVTMGVVQILFLGGSMYACMQGFISVGDVVMFNAFFLTLSHALSTFLAFLPQLLQSRESLDSVIEILNAGDLEENEGKPKFDELEGSFELENICFKYPEGSGPVIQSLSINVEAGTSLALIGPSGSGKSTLLALLLGFIHPDSGRILLDGMNLMEMDRRSYRQRVGVVTQDPVFISGTVWDNVAYGNDNVSEAEMFEALGLANALEFVEELPEGLHTRLGTEGVRLSGGQMQRLAIARAIIRDPKVLILDEATSALDMESENLIRKAIDNVMKNRTTFIVAHRVSTVRNADRIAILDAGHLVACDTPEELLKEDNFYSRAIRYSEH